MRKIIFTIDKRQKGAGTERERERNMGGRERDAGYEHNYTSTHCETIDVTYLKLKHISLVTSLYFDLVTNYVFFLYVYLKCKQITCATNICLCGCHNFSIQKMMFPSGRYVDISMDLKKKQHFYADL